MNCNRLLILAMAAVSAASAISADNPIPGAGPGGGARYATDAYPGFDRESEIVSPSRKEPKWFSFIFGPACDSATEQLAHCVGLMREEKWSKAVSELDALVREWPTSPEAPKAQKALAEVLLKRLFDYEEAFAAYRYMLDFYSLQCDYAETADTLYRVAGILKREGKDVMFIRFANTVDVRRAYEACVLHAPGAKWVPEAFLTIASLREDEQHYAEAVKVYENLRNLYPESGQAKTAWSREAEVRMLILEDMEYNKARYRDTVAFLGMALVNGRPEDAERIVSLQAKAKARLEEESYLGAKFYDSPTRTKRSAINAYEKFLSEYPESAHADSIRARVEQLKGEVK